MIWAFADAYVHNYSGFDGVYQVVEHTCKCWHVRRKYVNSSNNPDCTNDNRIVQICANSDGNYTIAGGAPINPPENSTERHATGTATCTGTGVCYRPRPTMGTATCGGNGLRVRSTPELKINVMRQLNDGQRFEVNEMVQNGWVQVNVQGDIGWMYEQYMR